MMSSSLGSLDPSCTHLQHKLTLTLHTNLSQGREGEGGLLLRGSLHGGGCVHRVEVSVHPAWLVLPAGGGWAVQPGATQAGIC